MGATQDGCHSSGTYHARLIPPVDSDEATVLKVVPQTYLSSCGTVTAAVPIVVFPAASAHSTVMV